MSLKILVVLAHPGRGSFNHAIAGTVSRTLERAGHLVTLHDLYDERFPSNLPAEEILQDAVLPPVIEKHCVELSDSDGVVVIHPNWWGQPPAILKGWIDRVFRPGVAYSFQENDSGEGIPKGLLRAHTALVFNTSNTPPVRDQEVFGDPLETIWKNCIFDLCGVKVFFRKMFSVVVVSTLEQRKRWLEEVQEIVTRHFPPASSAEPNR